MAASIALALGGLIVLFRTTDSQFITESVSDTVQTETSRTGRFTFGALPAGDVIVAVCHSELPEPWTCVPSAPLKLEPGKTAEVTIELVRGVKVSGRITDKATGKALPGYSLEDCDQIHTANEINRVIEWNSKSDVGSLAGKTVSLRFVIRDADLYAFQCRRGK